ncbi:MAG: IclR family transcriptional regulator [Acidimicrobiales bacterium]
MAEEKLSPTTNTVRSLERAFDIMRVLRESRVALRLTDIARETGNHLATTQRLLNVLVKFGYVTQEGTGYSIGITSLLNAHNYLVVNGLNRIALPIVQELVATSGLTASLSVRVELTQVLLLRIEGSSPLRYQLPVGEPMPLYLGGARTLAATLEPDELERLLEEVPEIRLASGQIVTHEEFIESLARIRQQGYVFGSSQRYFGAAAASVPVFDTKGEVIASLQLSGLAEDFDDGKVEWCVAELKRASGAITTRLP